MTDARPAPLLSNAAARHRLPGWAQALAVLAASRLLTWFAVQRHAVLAGPRRDGSSYGYLDIVGNWDAAWYASVAAHGYPGELPLDAAGVVEPNAWAFHPLYPYLVRPLTALGLSWPVAATPVSLACAGGAVVLLHRLVERRCGPAVALWTVALLCFFPSAAVLQLPYAESLALLLLFAVLACLQSRRYAAAVPLVLLAGLARPIAVPLAAVVVLHAVRRVREGRAAALSQPLDHRPDRPGERPVSWVSLGVLVAAAGVAAVEWSAIAAAVTGEPSAYPSTMAGWRASRQVVPFEPWWQFTGTVLGEPAAVLVLAALAVGLVVWVTRPRAVAVLGRDGQVWVLAYAAYLAAVLESFTSLPRYLLPMAPLGALLVSHSPSRGYRATLVVASATAGLVWLAVIWRSPATMAP